MRCRGRPEVSIGEIDVWICVVCAVEEIEYFEPELEVDAFRDRRVFIEVDVRLKKVWLAEQVRFFIAALSECRNGEVTLRDRSRQPSLVIRQLVIADGIRIIEVVAICVVIAAAGRVTYRRICSRWARWSTRRSVGAYRIV